MQVVWKIKVKIFFWKDKICICIPFYPDTEQTLSKLALDHLKKNIPISTSNLNLIIDRCNGDRKILLMELEKLNTSLKMEEKLPQKILQN